MVVIIDNYDSFTYNLVDLVKRTSEVVVYRNDEVSAADIAALNPRGIVISPGPGRPRESKVSWDFTFHYHQKFPILGVCLGHQVLGEVLGMKVVKAQLPMHGKTSLIYHKGESVFKDLPSPLRIMRYHSLLLAPVPAIPEVVVTAETGEKEIMAIAHRSLPLVGLQFHPESILSEGGDRIVANWLATL